MTSFKPQKLLVDHDHFFLSSKDIISRYPPICLFIHAL